MADLPPDIMLADSVGWWNTDAMVGSTGGIAIAQNRVRNALREVRNAGMLVQATTTLRPTRTINDLTFSADYLRSTSSTVLEAGREPELWVVAEVTAQSSDNPSYMGLFEVGDGTVGSGLTIDYTEATRSFSASFVYGNASTSTATLEVTAAGLHLVNVRVLPTYVELQVGDDTAQGLAVGEDGAATALDYVTMGAVDNGSQQPWTGRLQEAFLSRANGSAAQRASMRQYFESRFPEVA